MSEFSSKNFGLLIAYVLPGFVILFGLSFLSPTALGWLQAAEASTGPSVGGFLYAFIVSVACGVTASAIRWLVLDKLHQLTGIKRPRLDWQTLEERLRSFDRAVEDHYRYYEFYGGMLIASGFSYLVWRMQQASGGIRTFDLLFLFIEVVFVLASRDALRNYYGRAARVLGILEDEVSHDKRIRPSRRSSDCDRSQANATEGSGDFD